MSLFIKRIDFYRMSYICEEVLNSHCVDIKKEEEKFIQVISFSKFLLGDIYYKKIPLKKFVKENYRFFSPDVLHFQHHLLTSRRLLNTFPI